MGEQGRNPKKWENALGKGEGQSWTCRVSMERQQGTPGGFSAVPLLPLLVPILTQTLQGHRKNNGNKRKGPNQKEKIKEKRMKTEEAAPGQ